ncbi:hypothetical protein DAMA08_048260 [Martiniozyma asiatica (nom. inval.)]|nr:hypothetical protein DAMA08_048260 [Martiniozyma asiatica]
MSISLLIGSVLKNPDYLKLILKHRRGIYNRGGIEEGTVWKEEMEREAREPGILWLHFALHLDGVNVLYKSYSGLDVATVILLDLPHHIGLQKEMIFTPISTPATHNPEYLRDLLANLVDDFNNLYTKGEQFEGADGKSYHVKAKLLFSCSDNLAQSIAAGMRKPNSDVPCIYCNGSRKLSGFGSGKYFPIEQNVHSVAITEMSTIQRKLRFPPFNPPTWEWYCHAYGPYCRSVLQGLEGFNLIKNTVVDLFHTREEFLVEKGLMQQAYFHKFIVNFGGYHYEPKLQAAHGIKIFSDVKLQLLHKSLFKSKTLHLSGHDYGVVLNCFSYFFYDGIFLLPNNVRFNNMLTEEQYALADMVFLQCWCQLLSCTGFDYSKVDFLVERLKKWAIEVQQRRLNTSTTPNTKNFHKKQVGFMGLHWHNLIHLYEQLGRCGNLFFFVVLCF